MPLLLHPRCPKPVQISGLGTGTQLSYAQISRTADLEYSVWFIIRKLEQVVTHRMPYYFSWFTAQTIYRPVCLFPYMKLQLEL